MKKLFRIKTSEIAKLTSNKKILTETQEIALNKYCDFFNIEPKKFLAHGQDIVLIIGQDNKYYITSKQCYQPSLINILKSVDIDDNDIVIYNRSTVNNNEIDIETLKTILK